MYGAKESAKPLVTLDTFENKYEQPRRKKSTVKSRLDVLEDCERHNKEFNCYVYTPICVLINSILCVVHDLSSIL